MPISIVKNKEVKKKKKITPHYLLKLEYMIGDENGTKHQTKIK